MKYFLARITARGSFHFRQKSQAQAKRPQLDVIVYADSNCARGTTIQRMVIEFQEFGGMQKRRKSLVDKKATQHEEQCRRESGGGV